MHDETARARFSSNSEIVWPDRAWRIEGEIGTRRVSRKRWGSASTSAVVRVNWRIVQTPMRLVDYVVAHELAHLRHPNHTPDFWATLERVMPDYAARKTRLRAIDALLEW